MTATHAELSTLGTAALDWARRGWPVLPLGESGKLPKIPSAHPEGDPKRGRCKGECGKPGHGVYDASTDASTVRAWWGKWPDANIGGSMLGRLGVDLDPHHGSRQTCAELTAQGHELPPTRHHLGGQHPEGRSHHLIYSLNGHRPNRLSGDNKLGTGIDIKAGPGSYLVLPPSRYPDGGHYEVALDVEELPAPEWVVEMALARTSSSGKVTDLSSARARRRSQGDGASELARKLAANPDEGARHGHWLSVAGHLAPRFLDDREVFKELMRHILDRSYADAELDTELGNIVTVWDSEKSKGKPAVPAQPLQAGAAILADIVAMFRRYVHFRSEAQLTTVGLWTIHTHAIDAADWTPYLDVRSPTKQAGKSVFFDVAALLVNRPLSTVGITAAALFRIIDQQHPTLLLDEADRMFSGDAELRSALIGVLDGGFERDRPIVRSVQAGNDWVAKVFQTFGPKAFAGIGDRLPDTVADRSIRIALRRKLRTEPVEKFRKRRARPVADPLRDRIAGWAQTALPRLEGAEPELPEGLSDRAYDIWEPLVAIADLAGEGWPERARTAATELSGIVRTEDEGTLLIAHVHEIFKASKVHIAKKSDGSEWIRTEVLLQELVARDDGPWAEKWAEKVKRDETLGPSGQLARLLRPFEIQSGKFQTGGRGSPVWRGYNRADFADAFARYLEGGGDNEQQTLPDTTA